LAESAKSQLGGQAHWADSPSRARVDSVAEESAPAYKPRRPLVVAALLCVPVALLCADRRGKLPVSLLCAAGFLASWGLTAETFHLLPTFHDSTVPTNWMSRLSAFGPGSGQ